MHLREGLDHQVVLMFLVLLTHSCTNMPLVSSQTAPCVFLKRTSATDGGMERTGSLKLCPKAAVSDLFLRNLKSDLVDLARKYSNWFIKAITILTWLHLLRIKQTPLCKSCSHDAAPCVQESDRNVSRDLS